MPEKCVLIYDDDDEIRSLCKYVLSPLYRIETFSSCINLFLDIQRKKPDIILMDLMMPQIDGASAIRALHENNATRHIPVILFSAGTDLEKISKSVKATAFINKPFGIKNLKEIIAKHIR